MGSQGRQKLTFKQQKLKKTKKKKKKKRSIWKSEKVLRFNLDTTVKRTLDSNNM